MRFTHLFIAGLAAATLLFQACTTSGGDDTILNPYMDEDTFNRLPPDQQELLYTNFFLQAFYVNAETEVRDADSYLGAGARNGFTEEDYEFPDVSYMYSTLSDNFTNYFSPYIAERIMNRLVYSESAAGIGADFQELGGTNCTTDGLCTYSGTLIFKHVYINGPADKAGVLKGDTLLMIDGREPRNEQHFRRLEAVFDAGETVPFAIKRGEDTLAVMITFDEYFTPTVFVDTVESIPVITVTEFTDTTTLVTGTYGEFVAALEETAGATSTIIDLRGNPGGTVEHCVNMASELLSKNDTIITIISHTIDTLTEEPYIDTTTYCRRGRYRSRALLRAARGQQQRKLCGTHARGRRKQHEITGRGANHLRQGYRAIVPANYRRRPHRHYQHEAPRQERADLPEVRDCPRF